ncbi:MAG: putative sugar nucleotidyl transferase [Gemmataceae bacterium]
MRVCLYEDASVADLEPICLTRPAFDLLLGCGLLAEKQLRHFRATRSSMLVRPFLAPLTRKQYPSASVNDLKWLRQEPVLLVNGRWLAPEKEIHPPLSLDKPIMGICDEEIAYCLATPDMWSEDSLENLDGSLRKWQQHCPVQPVGGRMLHHLWDLVDGNGEEIIRDAALFHGWVGSQSGASAIMIGSRDQLLVHGSARIEPMVVVDTTRGPVVIDRDAVIKAFTRLEGPCYIGPESMIFGGKVQAGTSIGPNCRIGGEVEQSIVWGYSNKYHDGFLGHSYLGAWVNLAAGTSTSDLRNDYGEIRVSVAGKLLRTGKTKIGSFLGDHTKTGLGTLLNTGTSAGVFCQILPTGTLLPRTIPSFTMVVDGLLKEQGGLETMLQTAHRVMGRRSRHLDEQHETMYRHLVEITRESRRKAIEESDNSRLQGSAGGK